MTLIQPQPWDVLEPARVVLSAAVTLAELVAPWAMVVVLPIGWALVAL